MVILGREGVLMSEAPLYSTPYVCIARFMCVLHASCDLCYMWDSPKSSRPTHAPLNGPYRDTSLIRNSPPP